MNLEEEIEKECFFTKFGRVGRKLVFPLIIPLVLSCSKGKKKNIIDPDDNESIQPKQEIVLTTSQTNQNGETYFTDYETHNQVEVQVVDTNNNTIKASNLDITYADGKNVEALFLQDPNNIYLPSRTLFSNSSATSKPLPNEQIRILKTGKSEEFGGIYHIETIKDKNMGQLLVDWRQENGYGWTLHCYLSTLNKEDVLKYYETQGKICDFFYDKFLYVFNIDKDKKIKPSDFIDKILKYGEISGDINAERWDVYNYSGKHIADNICFVPSNAPTLTLNEPRVEGSNVTLTWKGNDVTIYKQIPTYFPTRDDPTILLGSTKESDLTYFYKISKNNVIAFQDSTVDNYKIYKNLEDGDYNLEVLVQDEVGNKSNSLMKNFKIGEIKPPEPQERPSKIAFASDLDGNYEIYLMNINGTNQVNITNHPAEDYDPDWSPDGTKIAFASDRDGDYNIYIMDVDGTNQKRLTNNSRRNMFPSWSPDGTKIAFSSLHSFYEGYSEIYIINADGTNQKRLTNNRTETDNAPSWSPDGTKIAFSSGFWDNVYVMNTDGSNLINLTNYPEGYRAYTPSWSPDGTKIAFSLTKYHSDECDIWVMNTDGSNLINLTNTTCCDERCPSWSPDGTKIAFSSDPDKYSFNEIYIMNCDGTNRRHLTNDSMTDTSPSWSPYLDK